MRLKALALMTMVVMVVAAAAGSAAAQVNMEKLLNPASLNEKAPEKYKVKFDTPKGEFIVEVTRDWAPNGADRFYNLVKNGFYDDCKFFRNIEGFMVQFGINGNPKVSAGMMTARIKDDPVKQSNRRGYITFAMAGPDTRTSQVFINYGDNSRLDSQNFAPFGKVTKGMSVVESLYNQYGGKPSDSQAQIQTQGNAFLEKEFPKLDFVKTATIVPDEVK
ncbi:MAG: cyclophilin type peptidyl-prolyl cis-trans isomerase [Acidobacteria bacterium]|nr:cyclophilin type peptidyl-prolyl cis-trans isomerase [Acidobacteriota bacterium]